MSKPDEYASPAAIWAAIKSAARNGAAAVGLSVSTLTQLLMFDRFLARVFQDETPFVLKGGTRMLAFLPRARATVDIDLETAITNIDDAVDSLDALVRRDIGDKLRFTRVSRSSGPGSEDQPQVTMVKLVYEAAGTGQRVKIDLAAHDRAGAATIRAAPGFRVPLGRAVPSPDYVMIAIEQQIADKVAAMMERRHGGDGRSSRAKDLVDLALIAQNLPCDAAQLRIALDTQIETRDLEPFLAIDTPDTIRLGYPERSTESPRPPPRLAAGRGTHEPADHPDPRQVDHYWPLGPAHRQLDLTCTPRPRARPKTDRFPGTPSLDTTRRSAKCRKLMSETLDRVSRRDMGFYTVEPWRNRPRRATGWGTHGCRPSSKIRRCSTTRSGRQGSSGSSPIRRQGP